MFVCKKNCEAKIVQTLQELIKATNILHIWDVQELMREYLSAVIQNPGIIDGMFLSLEARRFRCARLIVWTVLKEFRVRVPIE